MTKQQIWILVGALIVLAIVSYFIYKSIKPSTTVVVDESKPGIGGILGGIFQTDWWKNLFGGGNGNGNGTGDPCAGVQCDPNRDGWDMNGLYNNCCA